MLWGSGVEGLLVAEGHVNNPGPPHGLVGPHPLQQKAPHLRAAVVDVILRPVGAYLVVLGAPAPVAVEEVAEEYGRDPQVRVVLEYLLSLKGPVVAADTGVVPADDEVAAPIVLPDDGVVYGLPGARVPHLHLQGHHGGAVPQEGVPERGLVGLQYHLVREVPRLLPASEGVDEEAVHEGQGRLLDVLVAEVGRVPSLEPRHGPPPR